MLDMNLTVRNVIIMAEALVECAVAILDFPGNFASVMPTPFRTRPTRSKLTRSISRIFPQKIFFSSKCKNVDSLYPDAICSNRGSCQCGVCSCFEDSRGRIYGQFCECDDFSCIQVKVIWSRFSSIVLSLSVTLEWWPDVFWPWRLRLWDLQMSSRMGRRWL